MQPNVVDLASLFIRMLSTFEVSPCMIMYTMAWQSSECSVQTAIAAGIIRMAEFGR